MAKNFANIDHGVLGRLIGKHIGCRETLTLCSEIIASTAAPGDLSPKGLPIGNLTSQLWANIYLHQLDLYVKHVLRCHAYVRYMDDFVFVHHDKGWLHETRARVEAFLRDQLRLETNRKTQVFPVARERGRGLDFLGYHLWPTHRRLRKSSVSRIRRTLKRMRRLYAEGEITLPEVRQSIVSWIAHTRHANAHGLCEAVLSQFAFSTSRPFAPQLRANCDIT